MTGWKTFAASLVVALSGWIATPEMVEFLKQYPGWVTTGIGVVFALLRMVTKTQDGISGFIARLLGGGSLGG